MGIGAAVASVALGATMIEKHFTLSRADGGVDSAFSMEPDEMRALVAETQRAWQVNQYNMFRNDRIKDILRSILRPHYYFMKDLSPYSKRLMARNSTLENKYDRQRGFLLLSGEPLSCIDI